MGVIKGLLRLALWVGVPVLAVAGALQYFFVDRILVGHDAMAPTIYAGETVFVWRDADPSLGRIVVCDHPRRPGQRVIGRVMAIPGMTVDAERGDLVIDGRRPTKDVKGAVRWTSPETARLIDVSWGVLEIGNIEHRYYEPEGGVRLADTRVRQGFVYLLGDNRAMPGQDSRFFGPVDHRTCTGWVVMRAGKSETAPTSVERPWIEMLW